MPNTNPSGKLPLVSSPPPAPYAVHPRSRSDATRRRDSSAAHPPRSILLLPMTCTSNDKGEGDNSDEGEEFVCAAAMTNPPIS